MPTNVCQGKLAIVNTPLFDRAESFQEIDEVKNEFKCDIIFAI